MSSHRKHGERNEADFYATPPAVVKVGCDWAASLCRRDPRYILEPGSSTSAPFLAEMGKRFPDAHLTGIEYLPRDYKAEIPGKAVISFNTDFMAWAESTDKKFDLVITNPPFSLAQEFVQAGLKVLNDDGLLVYLLRLSWFAGKKRYLGLHKEHPPVGALVLIERPSFTGGGTDSEEYAFFAYRKTPVFGSATIVSLKSWKPAKSS